MKYEYSNNIRNFFLYLENMMNYLCENRPNSDIYVDMLLYNAITEDYEEFVNTIGVSEISIRRTQIYMASMHLLLITDFYKKLNYLYIQGKLNESDENLFMSIKELIKTNNTDQLLKSPLFTQIKNSLKEYNSSSGLNKVVLHKALSEEDIELLSNFNPFFMDEYNHFNVEINEALLKKHLNIWIKNFGNEEAYCGIANFIISLYNIDPDIISDVIVDLAEGYEDDDLCDLVDIIDDGDLDSLCEVVKDFYDRTKDITTKK